MGISPTYTGATHPAWVFTFTDDEGGVVDLSSLTPTTSFSLVFKASDGTRRTGTGAWSWPVPNVDQDYTGPGDGSDGAVKYKPSTTDVTTPGNFHIQPIVTFPGADPLKADAAPLTILPAL